MEVVASAPGKVLITGGYLILERPNAGLILSTNARFYAIVKPLYEEIKPERWAWWMEQVFDQCQEEITKSLIGARAAFLEIRILMQHIGKSAGVPIKPESQTRLLDATMNMDGVLLGIPGAGGFDAIFAIVLGEADHAVAKAWSSAGVLPAGQGRFSRRFAGSGRSQNLGIVSCHVCHRNKLEIS